MSKKVILNDKYHLGGGMGSWAKSFESGIKEGDTRYIGGLIMYAFTIYRRGWFKPDEVNWIPVDPELGGYDRLRLWMSRV